VDDFFICFVRFPRKIFFFLRGFPFLFLGQWLAASKGTRFSQLEGTRMASQKFSHDIDPASKEAFDRLADELNVKKYKMLETMIAAFAAMNEDIQRRLLSSNAETRQPAMEALRQTTIRLRKGKQ